MTDIATTREAAREMGLKAYFTGIACPKGHLSARRAHNGECCECGRLASRERARKEPRERKRERNRAWWGRNAESINAKRRAEKKPRNPDSWARQNALPETKARKHEWYLKNKERLYSASREWKRENAEKVKEAKARYYKENPHIARNEALRRRARKRSADGVFAQHDIDRIFSAQKGRCACCKKRRKLTVDHIVPLVKGGTNWPANLQGLCLSCNASKQARDPIEFMQQRGMLL